MRNKEITLKEPVPNKIRKIVYQQALKYYQDFLVKPHTKYLLIGDEPSTLGLCLLLPCILWDLRNYLNNSPIGDEWNHRETVFGFPEIREYTLEISETKEHKDRLELRIKVLTEILTNLK